MKVTMVAAQPISVLTVDDVEYRPDDNKEFSIDDAHVEIARIHGLVLKGEPTTAPRHDPLAALRAENDQLRAKLADRDGAGKNGGRPK